MPKPCKFAYTCEYAHRECREPRETLLVDALAEAARGLMLELSSFLIEEARPVWGNTNTACLIRQRDKVKEALARYKKEVGDACDLSHR